MRVKRGFLLEAYNKSQITLRVNSHKLLEQRVFLVRLRGLHNDRGHERLDHAELHWFPLLGGLMYPAPNNPNPLGARTLNPLGCGRKCILQPATQLCRGGKRRLIQPTSSLTNHPHIGVRE